MSHLESLVAEYLEWQGYLVRRNTKVGRLAHGGWEMELDIVGYHPKTQKLVHYEPSIDALSWDKREARYVKNSTQAASTFCRRCSLGCRRKSRLLKSRSSSHGRRTGTASPGAR